jgi:GTPase
LSKSKGRSIPIAVGSRPERAVLVGVSLLDRDTLPVEDSLDELALLADTAGAEVVDRLSQRRDRPDAGTFVGKGFAERLGRRVEALEAAVVIFDDDLSPGQVKNLSRTIPVKLIDRTGLILDIFAERARTREARTQVELAQLQYLLPRLTRAWTHLSRQVGGIGTRGPGETQLEVDRRMVRRRIGELQQELEKIGQRRSTQRRGRAGYFQATLVGYTNAGKSTLLNRLTRAGVPVENRLFATLDATTRIVRLPGGESMLLTDTVGFIRKLPAGLVASFRSTLEEAVVADLLIHLIDLSHPHYEEHITSAHSVLEELGILEHPTLMVFNKADRVTPEAVKRIGTLYPEALVISAAGGTGLESLTGRLAALAARDLQTVEVMLPLARSEWLGAVHRAGRVIDRRYEHDRIRLRLRIAPAEVERLAGLLQRVEGAHLARTGGGDE